MSLSATTSAAVFTQFGKPEEVLEFRDDWPVPEPAEHELRLRVLASPINPADINLVEGRYGVKPELPAVGGIEGVAEVMQPGSGVGGYRVGDRVLLPAAPGAWRHELCAAASEITPLPRDLDLDLLQAAMLSINPPTAWRMLHDFVDLQPGDWVLQNASNSGVGLAVAAIAKVKGWRTINLARRREALDTVQEAGGDVQLLDDSEVADRVKEATGGAPIRLALNAVGGESALRMANSLAPDGKLVTYGAMGKQPMRIPNGLLIFRNLQFVGFWLSKWRKAAPQAERNAMIVELATMLAHGKLHTAVAASYPLDQIRGAVTHAQEEHRGGKVLLEM